MNWIHDLMSIVDSRTRQLNKQAEVDKHLWKMASTCPAVVAMFLLSERREHQSNASRSSAMSMFEKADFAVEQLRAWDEKYANIESVITTDSPCQSLNAFILRQYVVNARK